MVARNSASAASGSRITATPSGYCSGAVARVARVVGGAIAHRVGDGRAHIRVKTVEQRVLRAGPGLVRRGVDRLDDHGAPARGRLGGIARCVVRGSALRDALLDTARRRVGDVDRALRGITDGVGRDPRTRLAGIGGDVPIQQSTEIGGFLVIGLLVAHLISVRCSGANQTGLGPIQTPSRQGQANGLASVNSAGYDISQVLVDATDLYKMS